VRSRSRRLFGYAGSALLLVAAATSDPASAAPCGTGLNPILVTATTVAFGLYSPSAAVGTTSNGTVTVACTVILGATLPSFTVALSAGTNGQFAPRQLNFGSARLNYNLYTSASYATVWGDGGGLTATQSYASSQALASTAFTAYGVIPPSQFVAAGLYSDEITVTVTY
jgi:spore coat protein U-like protein